MNTVFQDQQNRDNPHNGAVLREPADVGPLFRSLRGRDPFVSEFVADNGYRLTVGYSEKTGFAQYSRADGTPPYLLAVAEMPDDEGAAEFLAGNTPTPIPRKYCLPLDVVEAIVREFVLNGDRLGSLAWEEV